MVIDRLMTASEWNACSRIKNVGFLVLVFCFLSTSLPAILTRAVVPFGLHISWDYFNGEELFEKSGHLRTFG